MRLKSPEKIVRIAAIALAIYLVAFGIAMAFFRIRPFWNDEWRLIYNIKFKTIPQLWGRLDLLQECPRLYLTVIKQIAAWGDYSYTTLRTPALVICMVNILFIFSLRKKLFNGNTVFSYLFVLIIISSQTFTDYIVQVKHYEMEIFACLLALWQLLVLLQVADTGIRDKAGTYLLLCLSMLAIPFFSYTYPIAITPVFPVILLHLLHKKHKRNILLALLPLALVAISIFIFYKVDVQHMMADKSMYQSYHRMLHNEPGKMHYIEDFWYLFALVGSGYIYEIVFAVLGIISFFYYAYKLAKTKKQNYTQEWYVQLYCILLVLGTIVLLLSGKIIGGVARLTAYSVPAIALLLVGFLADIKFRYRYTKVSGTISVILLLGLAGNIISTCIGRFTYPEYTHRIHTYWQTSIALKEARLKKIPLLYTAGVDGDEKNNDTPAPGTIQTNEITAEQIAGVDMLCAEVIVKVNPEYKVWDPIPVYEIPDTKWLQNYMQQLPPQYNAAIAGDGLNYIRAQR